MSFKKRTFKCMQEDLLTQHIPALRGKHSAASVEDLPDHRRVPVQVLQITMKLLETNIAKAKDKRKDTVETNAATVLDGFMYIYSVKVKKGLFYDSLIATMGIVPPAEAAKKKCESNELDELTKSLIVKAARDFLKKQIYKDGNEKEKMLEVHPYSEIKNFNVDEFLNLGAELYEKAEKNKVADDLLNLKKEKKERENKNNSSWKIPFWSSNNSNSASKVNFNSMEGKLEEQEKVECSIITPKADDGKLEVKPSLM